MPVGKGEWGPQRVWAGQWVSRAVVAGRRFVEGVGRVVEAGSMVVVVDVADIVGTPARKVERVVADMVVLEVYMLVPEPGDRAHVPNVEQ